MPNKCNYQNNEPQTSQSQGKASQDNGRQSQGVSNRSQNSGLSQIKTQDIFTQPLSLSQTTPKNNSMYDMWLKRKNEKLSASKDDSRFSLNQDSFKYVPPTKKQTMVSKMGSYENRSHFKDDSRFSSSQDSIKYGPPNEKLTMTTSKNNSMYDMWLKRKNKYVPPTEKPTMMGKRSSSFFEKRNNFKDDSRLSLSQESVKYVPPTEKPTMVEKMGSSFFENRNKFNREQHGRALLEQMVSIMNELYAEMDSGLTAIHDEVKRIKMSVESGTSVVETMEKVKEEFSKHEDNVITILEESNMKRNQTTDAVTQLSEKDAQITVLKAELELAKKGDADTMKEAVIQMVLPIQLATNKRLQEIESTLGDFLTTQSANHVKIEDDIKGLGSHTSTLFKTSQQDLNNLEECIKTGFDKLNKNIKLAAEESKDLIIQELESCQKKHEEFYTEIMAQVKHISDMQDIQGKEKSDDTHRTEASFQHCIKNIERLVKQLEEASKTQLNAMKETISHDMKDHWKVLNDLHHHLDNLSSRESRSSEMLEQYKRDSQVLGEQCSNSYENQHPLKTKITSTQLHSPVHRQAMQPYSVQQFVDEDNTRFSEHSQYHSVPAHYNKAMYTQASPRPSNVTHGTKDRQSHSYQKSHGTKDRQSHSYQESHGNKDRQSHTYQKSHGTKDRQSHSYQESHGNKDRQSHSYQESHGRPVDNYRDQQFKVPHVSPFHNHDEMNTRRSQPSPVAVVKPRWQQSVEYQAPVDSDTFNISYGTGPYKVTEQRIQDNRHKSAHSESGSPSLTVEELIVRRRIRIPKVPNPPYSRSSIRGQTPLSPCESFKSILDD